MRYSVDEAIQCVTEGLKGGLFREYEEDPEYSWYYAENRTYVIRKADFGWAFLVQAGSPKEALEKVRGARPEYLAVKEPKEKGALRSPP